MPPKRAAAKRKAAVAKPPLVADPFSASKRAKRADNLAGDEDKVDVSKKLSYEADVEEAKLDSSKENNEETEKQVLKYDSHEFREPSNGKEWNFKIASWNVNGVRAWLEKDGLDYIKAEDPDIVCLQELKCDKAKMPARMELKPYHCCWLTGDTQGYAGVGLMSKVKPLRVEFELDEKEHAEEGRTLIAEYDKFFLVNSYIPNSGRGLVRLAYRLEWEKAFRKKLAELDKQKPVIWCGDLNVAHTEIDLKNPKTNTKTAGFTKEERQCFTNLLSDGYFDSFRYLYPTAKDAYTFWSYMRNSRATNIGWRLDYFVLSERLKECLADNVIRSKVTGSDHCPIVLFLKL